MTSKPGFEGAIHLWTLKINMGMGSPKLGRTTAGNITNR